MGEKRCGACGETKALADFHRRSASKDGRAATCISCAAAYGKTYRESNAEQLAVSKKDWAHDNGRKVRVSRTGDRHLDHIIPLAKGGSDTVGNLCVACPRCNQTKNARMPEDYAGQSEMAL
jgi:5-methylcytosine-specific restriction endonuclease McrA